MAMPLFLYRLGGLASKLFMVLSNVCAKFESFIYFKYEILHQLNFETDLRLFYHRIKSFMKLWKDDCCYVTLLHELKLWEFCERFKIM